MDVGIKQNATQGFLVAPVANHDVHRGPQKDASIIDAIGETVSEVSSAIVEGASKLMEKIAVSKAKTYVDDTGKPLSVGSQLVGQDIVFDPKFDPF